MPILSLKNLRFAFGGRPETGGGFSLEVFPGEFVAVAGASGAEKSKLLHTAAGFQKPPHGSVQLMGVDPWDQRFGDSLALRRKIGVVFQDPIFVSELTSLENVQLPLKYDGALREEEIVKKTESVLSQAQVLIKAESMPDELTPVARRKLALARAWIRDPDIVFYDEPAKSLDPVAQKTIYKIIHQYHENRKNENRPCAALLTCNDPQWVLELADKFLVLSYGTLTFRGDKTTIRDQKSVIEKEFLDSIPAP